MKDEWRASKSSQEFQGGQGLFTLHQSFRYGASTVLPVSTVLQVYVLSALTLRTKTHISLCPLLPYQESPVISYCNILKLNLAFRALPLPWPPSSVTLVLYGSTHGWLWNPNPGIKPRLHMGGGLDYLYSYLIFISPSLLKVYLLLSTLEGRP